MAAAFEVTYRVRVMDGLHAVSSIGVLCGGVGAGLLRSAGVDPAWILGGVASLIALTVLVNLSPVLRPSPRSGAGVWSGRCWSWAACSAWPSSSRAGSKAGAHCFSSAPSTPARPPAGSARGCSRARWRPVGCLRRSSSGLRRPHGCSLPASRRPSGSRWRRPPHHALVGLTGFVIAGGGLALSAPTLFGLAGRLGGEGGRGSALSTVAILGYLGFLVGPPLIGGVSSASSLRGGFLFLAAMAVILAACAPLLRERRR